MVERDEEHQRAAQILRATSTLARTMYRELVRAEYSRDEVLRFVNKLLEQVSADAAAVLAEPIRPAADPETGIASPDAVVEILEFECRRVSAHPGRRELLVLSLTVAPPPEASGEARRRIQLHLVDILRRSTRPSDVVGRLGDHRWLLILPWTSRRAVDPIVRRITRELDDEPSLARARLELRAGAWSAGTSARALLERVEASPPIEVLEPGAERTPLAVTDDEPSCFLALGGGASRALAHVGVYDALRRAGIKVRGIAGTSGGAMIGAMVAMGLEPDEIVARFVAFSSSPLIREMRRAFARERLAKRTSSEAERFFRRSNLAMTSESWVSAMDEASYSRFVELFLGPDRSIQGMPIPFSAAALDLVSGRAVHLAHGSLHDAVKASCAIPGLFPPQRRAEKLLVDGFVLSTLPSPWTERGPTPVLAVHLDEPLPPISSYANSVQIALRASALVHSELAREQLERADVVLSVPTREFGWLSFRDAREVADTGRAAAGPELSRLKAELAQASRRRRGAAGSDRASGG